jgi:hypothetical protein
VVSLVCPTILPGVVVGTPPEPYHNYPVSR